MEYRRHKEKILIETVLPLNRNTQKRFNLIKSDYISDKQKRIQCTEKFYLEQIVTPLDFIDTCNHTNERILAYNTLNSDEAMLIMKEIVSPSDFEQKNNIVKNVLIDYERSNVDTNQESLYVKVPAKNKTDISSSPGFVFPVGQISNAVNYFQYILQFKKAALERFDFVYFLNENELIYTIEDCLELYVDAPEFSEEDVENVFKSIVGLIDTQSSFEIELTDEVTIEVKIEKISLYNFRENIYKIAEIKVILNEL